MKKNNLHIKVIILSIFILAIICLPFLYHEIVNRSLVTDALLETNDKVPSLYQLGTFTGNHNEHPINLSTQLTNDLKEINQIKPEETKFDFYLSHPFDALNETFFLQVNFVSDTLWDEFNLNTNDNTFIYQNPNLASHLAVFMPLMREIVNVSLGLSIEISYTIGQRLPLSFEYQPIFPINHIRIFFNIDKLSSKTIEDFSLDFSLSITIYDEYLIRIDTLDEITDIVMQTHNQILLKIREYILIYINKSPLIEEIQSNKVYIDEFLIGYLSPIFLVLQFLLFLFTKSALIKEEEYFLLLLMRGFSTRTLKINGILKFGIFPVIGSTAILLPVMIYLSEDTFFRLLGLLIIWLIFHLSSSMWLVVSMVTKLNPSVKKIPPKREKSKFTSKIYYIPVFSGIIIITTTIGSFLNIPVFPLFVADYAIPTILIVLSCVLVWQFPLFLIENKNIVRGVALPVFLKLVSKKIFCQRTVLIALFLSSMIFGYNMIDIQYLNQKDSRALPRADFQISIINQVHNVISSNLIQALQAEDNLSALSIISMPLEVIDHYGYSRHFVFNIVNQSEYNKYIHDIGLVNEKKYFNGQRIEENGRE